MAGGVRLNAAGTARLRTAAPWLAVAAGLVVPALACAGLAPAAIEWRPGRAAAEPWRLWTAAWAHYGAAHLALNLAGGALVAALGVVAALPSRAAWAWALAWPLTHAALLLRPQIAYYGGLSGVLHAGVAVAAVALLGAPRRALRASGAMLLLGLSLKVAHEAPWAAALPYAQRLGIHVVPLAHAAGLLAGVLCAVLLRAWRGAGPTIAPDER